MKKWSPSLRIINKIIQDFHGSVNRVARELQCDIEDLKKYEALWPNNKLKKYFDDQEAFIQQLLAAKRRERADELKEKTNKKDEKLRKIRDAFEKHNGDREKVAQEIGCHVTTVPEMAKRMYYTFKDFQYYKPIGLNERKKTGPSLFPTNEQRIFYKDNPHIRYHKEISRRRRNEEKKCLEKKKQDGQENLPNQ
jgi:hypothetical protein